MRAQREGLRRPLGGVPPPRLTGARLSLHWGVQVIPAVADAWLGSAPDGHLAASVWKDEWGALLGRRLGSAERWARVGVRVSDLALLIVSGGNQGRRPNGASGMAAAHGEPTAGAGEFALRERPLAEGLVWVAGRVREATGLERLPSLSAYEEFAPGGGAESPFSIREADVAALRELARWFAHADRILRSVAATRAGASPVACWPHHLDIATLITLERGHDPEEARSIGVGLSPGDMECPEPYWYVSPWPRPEPGTPRPDLAGGGEWAPFGAILRGSAMVGAGDVGAQEKRARRFIDSGLRAARALLEG